MVSCMHAFMHAFHAFTHWRIPGLPCMDWMIGCLDANRGTTACIYACMGTAWDCMGTENPRKRGLDAVMQVEASESSGGHPLDHWSVGNRYCYCCHVMCYCSIYDSVATGTTTYWERVHSQNTFLLTCMHARTHVKGNDNCKDNDNCGAPQRATCVN